MSSLSFIHLASAGKKVSTSHIVANIRKYYPKSYYLLGSDAADDLSDIALINNCRYVHFTEKLGYPVQPYGYRIEKVIKWLKRFKMACQECNTTHIMMTEDDVWIKSKITVPDDAEMYCQYVPSGNIIPEPVIKMIEEFSGVKTNTNQYGGCGGSIFKVSTFLENYDRVIDFFKNNLEFIQDNYYPTLGWMDCYMVVFYMLCGKEYMVNTHMSDTHHHINNGFDYHKFVIDQPEHIEIVNNYKRYYWV